MLLAISRMVLDANPTITVDSLQGKDLREKNPKGLQLLCAKTLLIALPDPTKLTKGSHCGMGSTVIIVIEVLPAHILYQWFLKFSVFQNHLEYLLNYKLLGPLTYLLVKQVSEMA